MKRCLSHVALPGIVVALALLLTGCAANGVFVKKDTVYSALEKHSAECVVEARRNEAKNSQTPSIDTSPALAAHAYMAGRVERWYFQDCMERRGYRYAQITPDEWEGYKALNDDSAKTKFLRKIYQEAIDGRRKTL